MKSTSKVELSRAVLAQVTERYLGKTLKDSHELSDGWFNTIHVLEFGDGSRAVIKVSPPPGFLAMRYESDIIAVEVAVLGLLAAQGLKVPRVFHHAPDGAEIGHPWFIMEYLPGNAWSKLRETLDEAPRDSLDAAIADQSARVNFIAGPRFGRYQEDHCSRDNWPDSFLAMTEDLFADARDKALSLPQGEAGLRAIFQAGRTELGYVREARLVLWDLHDGNVIVDPAGPALNGFIDCDRAIWGDPLMEYYFRSYSAASPRWMAAYQRTCALAKQASPRDLPGADRRIALYDLYLALVMVIEVAYRGFDADHDKMVRALLDQSMTHCQALGLAGPTA